MVRNRNLDICMGCDHFLLMNMKPYDIPFCLSVDEPSSGRYRYFYCDFDRGYGVKLDKSLLSLDGRAREKYERREIGFPCPRLVEQQVSIWSDNEESRKDGRR